ncbi:pancreatic triacylglycerol lipase-like [Leguminivora glycinivorella]|uniref:pancreatic triacylglycerol lipase-like n=1 Tax=Leguminivora glycinivorella TaxID=1035111 RepID=UPI00200CA27D|nr:pancreatic triacylglycerol lipase-like [Leguminivora glycinivorella]
MSVKKMCSTISGGCKLLLLLGIFHRTQAAYLRCYKGTTLDNYDEVPLSNAPLLINSTCLNLGRQTVAMTFGYMGKVDGPFTTAILLAFLALQTINVILLNWQKEAQSGILGPLLSYPGAVTNAKIVGDDTGEAITALVQAGFNVKQLYLLGFSLGAHVMGYAGKKAKGYGYSVGRISGLDPARALFENTQNGLDSSSADHVDVIHTDPGGYGINCSLGTIDFWVNYKGKHSTQPGCPNGTYPMFSSEDLCSHDRCWKLFIESLQSPTAFPSAFSPDYYTWATNPASSTRTEYMGYSVNLSATGNYFLTTGPTSPYSLGTRGLYPSDNQTTS